MPQVCASEGLKRESIQAGRPNPRVGKWPPGANAGRHSGRFAGRRRLRQRAYLTLRDNLCWISRNTRFNFADVLSLFFELSLL
jgi:hypothetical protein